MNAADLYDLWGSLKTIPTPVIPPLPDEWEQYQAEQIASAQSEADQEAIRKQYSAPTR